MTTDVDEVSSAAKSVQVAVRLRPVERRLLDVVAARHGVTVSTILRALVRDGIATTLGPEVLRRVDRGT